MPEVHWCLPFERSSALVLPPGWGHTQRTGREPSVTALPSKAQETSPQAAQVLALGFAQTPRAKSATIQPKVTYRTLPGGALHIHNY